MLQNLKSRFKKPKEVISLQILADKCSGCTQCVAKCKRDVFSMDTANKIAQVTNLAGCVGCGKCVRKMCSNQAIELIIKHKDEIKKV